MLNKCLFGFGDFISIWLIYPTVLDEENTDPKFLPMSTNWYINIMCIMCLVFLLISR